MDTPKHNDRERLNIASLSGIAARHGSHLARNGGTNEAGVAELRDRSTDPHLLAHAIGSRDWAYDQRRELLEAAGANPADIDAVVADIERRTKRGSRLANLAEGLQRNAHVEGPLAE